MSSPCTRLARWSPSPARTICRKQTTWCSVGGVILGFTKAPTSGHTAFTGMTDRTIIFHFVWHYVICVCVCVCVGGCTCIGKLSSEPPDFHHGFIPQTVVLAKLGSTTSKFTSTNRTWCHINRNLVLPLSTYLMWIYVFEPSYDHTDRFHSL